MKDGALIYDWNLHDGPEEPMPVELHDETLRDGLQSPSARQPSISEKLELLHLMEDLGIDNVNIGLPGAGERVTKDVERLAREIANCKLHLTAGCAARTVFADIEPIISVSQRVGMPIEVHTFIGSSPIRQYVEKWDLEWMRKHTAEAVRFAVDNGCPAMYVTEDTVRADPETLKTLLSTAVECGASRVCICDTVGHATPRGVWAVVRFVREQVLGVANRQVKIDWHGHSDRGLSLTNALVALKAGAHRVHGSALGIGERTGNAPMDQLLVNLKLMGFIDRDLRRLKEYCERAGRYCGFPIPPNYPVVGRDAFRTGTGVHAAAIIKSMKEEAHWLRDLVYSGVRAGEFGFEQTIDVGPMSGRSNVEYWLTQRGMKAHPELVDRIFERAKASQRVLTEDEIYRIIVVEFITDMLSDDLVARHRESRIHAEEADEALR